MAVTGNRRYEDELKSAGVGTAATTANQNTQTQSATNYTPAQAVVNAQQQMQNVQAQKPQSYNSKYSETLDNILQQIQNPEKFKYSFDGDELFKYYADLYTQKGRQASMDAMGQAAALTGGYGNSYAQQVGNQAYDQYLLSLYDKGLDMRDRAYQQYQDQRADLYNQYGTLSSQDQIDYGRYSDDYNRWLQDLDYYTNMYNTESDRDYTRYADQRDYDENVRQFNVSMDWEKMSSDQKYAAEYCMSILANGQMPSEDLLRAAGLSADDAQKMMAQLTTGGGGGGGRKKNSNTAEITPQQKAEQQWEATKNNWIANYQAEVQRLQEEREEENRKKAAQGPARTGTRMINYNTKVTK